MANKHILISFEDLQKNPKLMDDFIMQYEGLVCSIVKSLNMPLEIYEDLKQVGRLAVFKGTKKFDSSKNVEFSTYVTHKIRGEVIKAFHRQYFNGIKVPERYNNILKMHYRGCTVDEICEETKVPRDRVVKMIDKNQLLSLDAKCDMSDDRGRTLGESISDNSRFEDKIVTSMVTESVIQSLPKFEKDILIKYVNGCSQLDIAQKIGRSQMTVSRALNNIKEDLSKELDIEVVRRRKRVKKIA